ncbi:MAG: hypothetical protein ACXVII_34575, partial [Solirubrobacteraceae bacterium]
ESSERLPIAPVRPMEAGSPTGFVVVGEVMTRRVGVRVSLDDDGRITRVEADYAPLIDPEDAEVIVPGHRDTYGLYDFGAEVSMPEPSVCDVVEVSEEFSAGLSAAGGWAPSDSVRIV